MNGLILTSRMRTKKKKEKRKGFEIVFQKFVSQIDSIKGVKLFKFESNTIQPNSIYSFLSSPPTMLKQPQTTQLLHIQLF